jgi:hypothetical protein
MARPFFAISSLENPPRSSEQLIAGSSLRRLFLFVV